MTDLFEHAASLPKPPTERAYGGNTYEAKHDYIRLRGQHERVFKLMLDGAWHTLSEIRTAAGGTETSASARIRDLRKPEYGGHLIERERVSGGLFRYRMKV